MHSSDFQGLKVYRKLSGDKALKKDGTPKDPKKLGKIHFPVFSKDGCKLVGFMVSLPDVVGMIKQPDRFMAFDAIRVEDARIVVGDEKANFDKAAAKRLGVDLNECLIWTGMDVATISGKKLGYCSDASFNPKTGAVTAFSLTQGAASSALLGTLEMPVAMLMGYHEGWMIVSDDAQELQLTGGAAAKAAGASVIVGAKVKQGAAVIDDKGSAALDKGSRALGKQLGKTKGMFGNFVSEYKKASK